jgi:hypothetical protein
LNLRRNPFGELTREERVRAAVVDCAPLCEWLDADRRAVQFIGDCGRGKTTRLLAIAECCPHAAYVYLPPVGLRPDIPPGRPLLIDEAQRLPWRWRRRVWRRGGPLVLGTHVDLARSLRRFGYEVRTVDVAAELNPRLLRNVLNRRIELARLDERTTPRATDADARALISRFGNDVRTMERYLYDRIQRCAGGSDGQVRLVD